MKDLIRPIQSSPALCYFIPLRSKYSCQHPVLIRHQYMFLHKRTTSIRIFQKLILNMQTIFVCLATESSSLLCDLKWWTFHFHKNRDFLYQVINNNQVYCTREVVGYVFDSQLTSLSGCHHAVTQLRIQFKDILRIALCVAHVTFGSLIPRGITGNPNTRITNLINGNKLLILCNFIQFLHINTNSLLHSFSC
jgi:hypothetical protein